MSESSSGPHKRQAERFEKRVPIVVIHGEVRIEAETRNISNGGAFVETNRELPFGSSVTIELVVPTQKDALKARGTVRWVEKLAGQVTGLGIQFEGFAPKDIWALNKLIGQKV